jgi:hypothetical protein
VKYLIFFLIVFILVLLGPFAVFWLKCVELYLHPPPKYVFMAWCLVKHRVYFTFTWMLIRVEDGGSRLIREVLPPVLYGK